MKLQRNKCLGQRAVIAEAAVEFLRRYAVRLLALGLMRGNSQPRPTIGFSTSALGLGKDETGRRISITARSLTVEDARSEERIPYQPVSDEFHPNTVKTPFGNRGALGWQEKF